MAKLTEPVKTFIVERLACYDRPQEVADKVKTEFGLTIPRQQVEEYDPTKRCKTQKWIDHFAATRAAWTTKRAGLAITIGSWRLEQLEDGARAAKKAKNYKLMADLLRQAAEEEGEMMVNHRAKPVAANAEEQQLAFLRAGLAEMDERTVPTTLSLVKQG